MGAGLLFLCPLKFSKALGSSGNRQAVAEGSPKGPAFEGQTHAAANPRAAGL